MTVALSKLNFRDVGGSTTADGRRLRRGVLYRSEGPAKFLAEHRREIADLGIKLIIDLRAESERIEAPHDWNQSGRLLNVNLTNVVSTKPEGGELRDDPTERGARNAMVLSYSAMPAALIPHWTAMIDGLIGGETPALVHCTAGKDRTGVVVAFLLRLIGVSQADAMADYQRSAIFAINLRAAGSVEKVFASYYGFVPTDEVIDAMVGVHPDYLEAAFTAIEQRFGSLQAYFAAAGIDAAKTGALRSVLLES